MPARGDTGLPRPRPGGRATVTWTALVLLVAVHVVIAWYPFRLDPPGRVAAEVERRDGVLAISGRRVLAEGTPPWAGDSLRAVDAVTVDLDVRPARTMQFGPARILTVSDGFSDANLMIGQERDSLVVRVRRERSDAAGNPPVLVPHAFAGGGWTRITVEVSADAIDVRVPGIGREAVTVAASPMAAWDPAYPLLLGDERPGGRVWHGEIRRAVVTADGQEVDYLAPGALEIAERTWYVPFRLHESLAPPDTRGRLRALLHVAAFVPVGMLLVTAWRRAGLARVVAAAGTFGLVLQVGKILLEGRHPSVLTVVGQCIGALGGAALVLHRQGRAPGRAGR